MFNLVKYRYAFLLLSLVVIVPGFISLVFFHLNVGIDFLGGANMQLRPQQTFSATQLTNVLKHDSTWVICKSFQVAMHYSLPQIKLSGYA